MARVMSISMNPLKSLTLAKLAPWGRRIAFYLLLLLVWEGLARSGIWPDYLFPGPLGVLSALVAGISSGTFLLAALVSHIP